MVSGIHIMTRNREAAKIRFDRNGYRVDSGDRRGAGSPSGLHGRCGVRAERGRVCKAVVLRIETYANVGDARARAYMRPGRAVRARILDWVSDGVLGAV
jgi:hypothetical protein